ncbi:MAG: hypothetical protein IJL17_18720 [Kiritimatiellae bacterium]|nr:hypothetical protein [Kiritimatiellia bacterium]
MKGLALGVAGGAVARLRGAETAPVSCTVWFACVLARARVAGWHGEVAVQASELLAGPADGDRFQIVNTGSVAGGAWHLATRGICLEFMLRLEIMGPHATSFHPRPGEAWEPVVNVGCARRLMARMLAESGVTVRFGAADGAAWTPFADRMEGADFVQGQVRGTAEGMAAKLGVRVEEVPPADLAARLARDYALPG